MVLLSKRFFIWILLANLITWPIAFLIMGRWLENFAYRTNIGFLTFIFSGIITLVITLLTISYQSFKAARANPVESLKYE
jgi:putative ABC transport system permease protein